MIRFYRKDGSSFDADELLLGVMVEDEGQEKLATFPFSDIVKIILDGGSPRVGDTDFDGMPLRVLDWKEEGSGLVLQLPLPLAQAEEVGRALAGTKVVAPPPLWTPGQSR